MTAACWCGETWLTEFCAGYARCPTCETLVSLEMPGPDIAHVADDERDFYGRRYWFAYQEQHLGHPTIVARARDDLPERCLYWLRTLLKYRRPPATTLELGAGHGGFVAMLRWAGFDATGLEISPWVVRFARETFGVPMLLGPVEEQAIAPASLDVIVLMDVLEHLRDPVGTMRHCLGLLRPDGFLLVQTPCYPEGSTYAEMAARSERPLEILQPAEHLYLFSQRAVRELFARLGAAHVRFEPPLFAQYDMFLLASRAPLAARDGEEPAAALSAAPAARMIQALLDERAALDALTERHAEMERDRALRLGVIGEQGRRLGEVEAERNILRAEVQALRAHQDAIEADRAARLAEVTGLRAEVAALHRQIHVVMNQLTSLQQVVGGMQSTKTYQWLRRLGYWGWVDRAIAQGVMSAARSGSSVKGLGDVRIAPLADYLRSIDAFNASQRNKELLDGIRGHNHVTVDGLNTLVPLRGARVLDIGASPHGYALERALEHGASLYVGVGLDIPTPEIAMDADGRVGILVNENASALPFPGDTFDAVVSVSTLEHVDDVDAVLDEIARVLRSGGAALLTFEPIWSCSYGHHLHHLGDWARAIPPWSHLLHGPDRFRAAMRDRWPAQAAVTLDEAVEWIYRGAAINRLTIREYRERLERSALAIEWIVDLKEADPDLSAAEGAAAATGLSVDELTTKGLSVLLRKK